VNLADTSGGGHAVTGAVLGGTAGDGWGRAAAYDAYADGLHTYALWYLRDHDAAADAVYCAFVAADRNHTNLQQPEQIQPWLYALLRRECRQRTAEADAPTPVSQRLRPKPDAGDESSVGASLMHLEGSLRRAEFQSLAWSEAEGLAPAHREVLELTIRHGLDSRGLALVLGLREPAAGLAPTRGFGLLADAWRELERSLAAAAVAASGRENCAQLAELTFGWSGKLNATLRAPLTEHVDRCSRCQHYLHTVIGTPSAPTILPFVAAPRALRDILLGELSDLDAASDAGIDLVAIGSRCGAFGPEGFPSRVDPSVQQQNASNAPAGAGRGPRRRQPGAGRPNRPQRGASPTVAPRPQPVHKSPLPGNNSNNGKNNSGIGWESGASIPPSPRVSEADDVYRAKGSWAEKVLPPDAAELWRPRPEPGFIETPSGRFATGRLPAAPMSARPRPVRPAARPPVATNIEATAVETQVPVFPDPAPLPRFATAKPGNTATKPPGTPPASPPQSGKPVGKPAGSSSAAAARARHKARPMKQAVFSAMALGAIGAVAAAAAAMLGVTSNPHSNTDTALDGSQSSQALGSASSTDPATGDGASKLSVSVTTGSAGSTGGSGGLLTGASGLGVGLLSTSSATGGTSGGSAASSAPTTASAGAFYVSVNQRSADPNSVQILLRNTGGSVLNWSAAPSVSWLTLSQNSGTLAAGQSLEVTATATSAAPTGQWTARIVFSPGGIVVTLHGGIPTSTDPTTPASGGGGSTAPSSPTTTTPSSPTTSPTSQSPTSTASASASGTASASDPASGSQPSTPTGAASNHPSTPPPSLPAHRR